MCTLIAISACLISITQTVVHSRLVMVPLEPNMAASLPVNLAILSSNSLVAASSP